MNITIESSLQSNHALPAYKGAHLSFILQSAEYLGLKISRDDAVVLLTQEGTGAHVCWLTYRNYICLLR